MNMRQGDSRPDPEVLLARLNAAESKGRRGQLKVFLGYAAGVGKTYAMLSAAQRLKSEGVDVVAGYVETHGRQETEKLLAGLELIPRKSFPHKDILLPEMDLDKVLERHPEVALVDELAHTNAPGARHKKRHQDVQELLEAGIDVYTTLNVQHLESLNDVVAQITGIRVRETVPDSIVQRAATLSLVDIPPDELLQRLKEGRVYVPEQAARAAGNFFRPGNLTALRELSMRKAAHQLDEELRGYMKRRSIPGPWPVSERVLVCVGPSPLSERLVRSASRMAESLEAEWFAVSVEMGPMDPAAAERVARHLELAEKLGAQTARITGTSIPEAALEFSRQNNVTKIVAGKPLEPYWREALKGGSLVDKLIRRSGAIDVYVISGDLEAAPRRARPRPVREWNRLLLSSLVVASVSALCYPLQDYVSPSDLVTLYLGAVVAVAYWLGRLPAVLASALSVLAFDFFFVPPRYTFAVSDSRYTLTFLGMFVVGTVVSTLTSRAREQAAAASRREAQTTALYRFSRDLSRTFEVPQKVVEHFSRHFGATTLLMPTEAGDLERAVDEAEFAVADWAFRHGQPAGRGTDTLPAARRRWIPIPATQGVLGVLGFEPAPELDRQLLEAFVSQAGLALERSILNLAAQRAQVLSATEKLQTALLNCVSHDLRIPLVSITGALSSLKEQELEVAERRNLIDNALQESERLNRLLGNLLNMTRIESGALQMHREPCDLQDLVGTTLESVAARLQGRQVEVDLAPDVPLVAIDYVLVQQVLINLLDNAVKFSPEGAPIDIQIARRGDMVEVAVADRGPGIPAEDLPRVFEKFQRLSQGTMSGVGLGLSICQGLVEAHQGTIQARPREGGGTVVAFTLPEAR